MYKIYMSYGVGTFSAEVIDSDPAFPLTDDKLDSLPGIVRWHGSAGPDKLEATDITVRPIGALHRRSFELIVPGLSDFSDQYGNNYHAIDIKGINFTNPHIEPVEYEDGGFRIFGLIHSLADITHAFDASRRLRAEGVLVEWVGITGEIKTLPQETLAKLGAVAVDNHTPEAIYQTHQETGEEPKLPNDWPQSAFMLARGVKSLYRTREESIFRNGASQQEQYDTLEAVVTQAMGRDIDSPPSLDEKAEYLISTLPFQIGVTLAQIHELGWILRYPHAANWSMAGEAIDTDAFRHRDDAPENPTQLMVAKADWGSAQVQDYLMTQEIANTILHYYRHISAGHGIETDGLKTLIDIEGRLKKGYMSIKQRLPGALPDTFGTPLRFS